jgi:hypothetical protein
MNFMADDFHKIFINKSRCFKSEANAFERAINLDAVRGLGLPTRW